MRFFCEGAQNLVRVCARVRASESSCLRILRSAAPLPRFSMPILLFLMCALPACPQDNGSEVNEFHGKGSEITVTVHDSSGEPIASAAMVKLYRDGTTLSRQGETSRGSAMLVVNNLGEFTVTVEAPGYQSAQKEVSVQITGRVQVDVYLRRLSSAKSPEGVPGRPLLAPKAKEAMEKCLQALGADKLGEAEKYVSQAMHLSPSHPDVLYVQGVVWLKERKWTQAQDALEKATQIDPSHARAFAALGMALCDQGKCDVAIEPLQKSLQLDPAGTWETRWTLAKAYYQHAQYEDALKVSQEALAASNEKAPEIALLVAQSLSALGRFEEAAQILRNFLRDHPDRREAATAQRWLERLSASAKIQPNPH
jgi:Flp pilus assembly protein TadD